MVNISPGISTSPSLGSDPGGGSSTRKFHFPKHPGLFGVGDSPFPGAAVHICCSHLHFQLFCSSQTLPEGQLPASPPWDAWRDGRNLGRTSPSPTAFSEISITPGYQKKKKKLNSAQKRQFLACTCTPLSPTIDLCLIKPWQ